MTKDIHAKPFNEGTRIKLELFKLYLRHWLPVFVKRKDRRIEIFDFFAGEGYDSGGNPGSPIIILDELKPYCEQFKINQTEVSLGFNDANKKKFNILQNNANKKLFVCAEQKKYGFCKNTDKLNCPFSINYLNEDFNDLFVKKYDHFLKTQAIPRFLFIDQYGIKHVNQTVFKQLANLKQTDFLFFIASSHVMRFKEQPEFQKYINIEKLDFSEKQPAHCHRIIFNYYKSILGNKDYFLGQFSIKKDSNFYGVIFGSNHHLGLKKFLDVAWKIDPHTGETNHDIDDDPIRTGQTTLDFFGTGTTNKVKKLAGFENELILFLKSQKSNSNIYIFALEKGISISKTNSILKELEIQGKLKFSGDNRQKGGFYLDYDHEKKIMIQAK